jgi:hypothetical protein
LPQDLLLASLGKRYGDDRRTDMSTPLTRDELRAEFAPLATKADLESLLTKIELECWGKALLARLDAIEHRVLAELARHTRAIVASMSPQGKPSPRLVSEP